MAFRIQRKSGRQILDFLTELAKLRIEVFREYPYLYEGTEDTEKAFLASYAEADGAVVVLASEKNEVIGASTGMPMAVADQAFRAPFEAAGENLGEWFYFGESVLRREYRGKGLGHRFFDEREAHALELGFRQLAFCSVMRPEDHPLKPLDHHPHDEFWRKRGFRIRPDLITRLKWPQVDSRGEEVENRLVFWTRDL